MSFISRAYHQLTSILPLTKKSRKTAKDKTHFVANQVLSQSISADENEDLSATKNESSIIAEIRKYEKKSHAASAANELFQRMHMPMICSLAFIGDIELFSQELEKAEDINIKVPSGPYAGFTALMMAAYNNHLEILKLLLENNCDISYSISFQNAKWEGHTALTIAKINQHKEAESMLLQAFAVI